MTAKSWTAEEHLNALLTEAETVPCDEGSPDSLTLEFPPYYDAEKFKRGQRYYSENLFAMHTGKFCGLIGVLAVPSILRVLIFTERSGQACTAYRRYFQTILHTALWYDDKMERGSKSWSSLAMIRKRHLLTGQSACKHGVGLISQKDMALTQFGFMGFILIRPHLLGIQHDNREDREALVHIWRCLGYMLGIQDKYNICRESLDETVQLCELILQRVYRPNLTVHSEDFLQMSRVLIKGFQGLAPLLDYDSFMFFTCRLADVDGHEYLQSDYKSIEYTKVKSEESGYKKLSWLSRLALFMAVMIHSYLLNISVIRWYYNIQKRIDMVLDQYLPYIAIYKFGWKKAFVDIKVDTYIDK